MEKLFSYAGKYTIGEELFIVDDVKYEIRLVGRIIPPLAETPAFSVTLINVVFFILSLYGLFTFSTVGLILGLIGLLVCGYNLSGIYKEYKNPEYRVTLLMKPNKDILDLMFKEKTKAIEFCNILEDQILIAVIKWENEE